MDAFLTALAPQLIELIAAIGTIIIGWLAAQARPLGIEIEARHREALHSTLMTGRRACTRAWPAGPGRRCRACGELRSHQRAGCSECAAAIPQLLIGMAEATLEGRRAER